MNAHRTTITPTASPADDATEIAVANPTDPHGAPLYEGVAADAAKHLMAGTYAATDLHGDEPVTYALVIAAEVRLFAQA